MHEWHSGGENREIEGAGGPGAGARMRVARRCVCVGGGGLFMMPSPINTAEVMTQIVLPLHTVTPVDLRPLMLDTLAGGRGEFSALWSRSLALFTFR